MSEDGSDQITIRIDEKLVGTKTRNDAFIFKVYEALRSENEGAYEPKVLSIGPYHRGKENLQKMEKYKRIYLNELLKQQGERSSRRYVAALLEVEEKARNCYAEDISLSQADFVEMMLLDGCFIIEFVRKWKMDYKQLENDPIFSMEWLFPLLRRDLLLFENQLPFFVLAKLFDMTKTPGRQEELIPLAISCLECSQTTASGSLEGLDIRHLLNLVHEKWCIPFKNKEDRSRSTDQKRCGFLVSCFHQFKREQKEDLQDIEEQKEDLQDIEVMKSVSELKEHGIEFKKVDQSTSWLDIKYEDGALLIPTLAVYDSTESLLRNLVAYEAYPFNLYNSQKIVTDYIVFMDCLVNSSNDVQTLRHEKIIDSWLGNDEVVSDMFNKIGNNVVSSSAKESTYSEIFVQVNKHCSRRRHRWIAELKRKYFNNPWSIIAFLAATLLLLLTLTQTIFSIHQNR